MPGRRGVAPPMMMMKGRMGPSMMGMMGMGYGES
jgi:hypothetical protein